MIIPYMGKDYILNHIEGNLRQAFMSYLENMVSCLYLLSSFSFLLISSTILVHIGP